MGTRANDFALLEKELELFFFLLVQVTKIPKKQLFEDLFRFTIFWGFILQKVRKNLIIYKF